MATGNPNDVRRGPDPMVDSAWGCGWAWLWFWLFLIVILFGGWGWGGWYGGWGGPMGWWGPRPPVQQAPQGQQPAAAPGVFLGRTVTMTGKVDQVYSPHAFTLAGTEGGQPLLVVRKDDKTDVKQGETVEITGKVEKFEEAALHKQTGVELNKVPAAEFAGRPAVVASKMSVKSSAARSGG